MKARNDCGVCGAAKPPGANCRACSRRRNIAYKRRHPERIATARTVFKKREWAAGAEIRAIKRAARRATLRDRRRFAKRKWKLANPGAVNASTALRFAKKLHAVPSWVNSFFVIEAYSLARLRTRMTGRYWHVDHIVPLRSKQVCGLHTHGNLRVILATENMRKGNRLCA